MTIVAQFSWDDIASPDFGNPARVAWREAVAEIAEKAKATLPECNGRVEKATAIVLNGDVELLEGGKAKVASQSNGQTVYHIANGECDCNDYPKAPSNWCKHRIARGVHVRALALAKAKLDAGANGQATAQGQDAPAQPSGPVETPQGVPPRHVVVIQGKPFVKFAGLLQMAHERGLVALTADWTYNDAELSLAHAVATFQDGRRFEESGDATQASVNRKVAVHFRRVALTRAKARVLRDALGVDLVAVEELADSE
ncbi:MAG: hypothetical protein FJZ47_11670 [Candidatus Tectomicrobia bacterium]|uniref:SWIM-type domain-containing protein n=1 Tax=Tectimicrobiota bacterium TaxID=2528274 RepID=A0A938B493_UNCTE|nr:hypothetical protein [Candidatus Tectomicrobia bacterium]